MGGWSVMVMILCVYKWSEILVSVCVQVRLNVYKWSLCTSDPFLCVQVIPLPAGLPKPVIISNEKLFRANRGLYLTHLRYWVMPRIKTLRLVRGWWGDWNPTQLYLGIISSHYKDPFLWPIRIQWNVSQGFCCRCSIGLWLILGPYTPVN